MRRSGIPLVPAVAALVPALLLTACGSGARPVVPDPPAGADTLVLSFRETPGMLGSPTRTLPRLSLYGDHRLIVADDRVGALQRATVYPLAAGRFSRIYQDAYRARAEEELHPATSDAVDGGAVVLRLATAGRALATTRAPLRADGALDGLRAGLDPEDWPEDAFTAGPEPYTPTRLALIATDTAAGGLPGRAWPFDPPADVCSVIGGAQLTTALELARTAGTTTVWSGGGRTFRLDFRPLLPDEPDCAGLEQL